MSGQQLTSHGVGARHEVEGDGVGRVGGRVFQASLWDFVEAVRGGSHVLIHTVQEGVGAWSFLSLPQFEAASRALAMFPTPVRVL